MITWCVAHTHPLKEEVAKHHLLEQGFDVYLPKFKKMRRHARKVEEVLVPLFPRYIFIGMDLKVAQWRRINGTRGISYLLKKDDLHPADIPLKTIQELKSQEISEGLLAPVSLNVFTKGKKVRILEGAFREQIASFEGFDDKSRVHLLLNFLGRETTLSLPVYAIEAA